MSVYLEISRVIRRNEMLCDGSPRREKGYRAYVRYRINWTAPWAKYRSSQAVSPLCAFETEARDWNLPDDDVPLWHVISCNSEASILVLK